MGDQGRQQLGELGEPQPVRLRGTNRQERKKREPVAAWEWRGQGEDLDSPLWPVLRSAAELLASPEAHRLRVCAGPDCGWMYVDRSRNRLRRWCEMATCGTEAKTRRRRAKSRS